MPCGRLRIQVYASATRSYLWRRNTFVPSSPDPQPHAQSSLELYVSRIRRKASCLPCRSFTLSRRNRMKVSGVSKALKSARSSATKLLQKAMHLTCFTYLRVRFMSASTSAGRNPGKASSRWSGNDITRHLPDQEGLSRLKEVLCVTN